jgi:predicted alpha/beta-hydrolase family hydrolase
MRPYVAALRARGLAGQAVDLPRRGRLVVKAEAAVDAFLAAVGDPGRAVVGGHSYGGRVASLVAARHPVQALVLLSYPLHPPGHPESPRTAHWPLIECPVLLLSGDSDPFARVDLLRRSVRRLPKHELHTFAGLGHDLLPVLDRVADRMADFLRRSSR